MNSLCLFKLHRISILSNLKLANAVFMSSKARPMLLKFHVLSKLVSPVQIQFRSFWETFPSAVLSFHMKDGLKKEDHELVYKSKLFNYAFYSQLFSMSCFGVIFVYSSYHVFRAVVSLENTVSVEPFVSHFDLVTLFAVFLFSCQSMFLYYLSQRAVLRVYHQKALDKYVFITLAVNPFRSRLVYCKPGELQSLNIEGLSAMFGNYNLHGKKLFVKYNGFFNMWHYNRLTNPSFS